MRLAAIERAAELTADAIRRRSRLLRAAELALDLGQIEHADYLLDEIDPVDCGPLDRARLTLILERAEASTLSDVKAVDSLLEAATRAKSAGGTDLALRLLQAAAIRSWSADMEPAVRNRILAVTRRIVAPEGDQIVLSIRAMSDPEHSGPILSRLASAIAPDTCGPRM